MYVVHQNSLALGSDDLTAAKKITSAHRRKTQSRNAPRPPGEPRVDSPSGSGDCRRRKQTSYENCRSFRNVSASRRARLENIRGRVPLMSRTAATTGRNNELDLRLNACWF
ncbi:MAG: hypothetical protein DMG01_00080 [Acidobacteria bacterium]|nr:MAG: hypothetical protein DMG01_00080 [Acidobacteriota bacterium]